MAETTKKAVSLDELSHFKAKQDLLNANTYQKKGETDLIGAVRYDAAQVLTEEQKAQARANIGAGTGGGGGSVEGAVLYNAEQALDEDDKARARANIGTTDGTWENMPDKPFGSEGVSFIMPSDTSSMVAIQSQSLQAIGGINVKFVKAVSAFATAEETYGGVIELYFQQQDRDMTFVVDESYVSELENGFALIYSDDGYFPLCINAKSVGSYTLPTAVVFGEDAVFSVSETGFYVLYTDGMAQVKSYEKEGEIKTLDKKYLPEDVVTTDENGLVPASVLPSYVDDVVEGYRDSRPNYGGIFYEDEGLTTHINGESGKIYVDLFTGNTYRWSGSQYVQLNPPEITFATTSDIDELFN